jgi:AcrR family transcriptional regulator
VERRILEAALAQLAAEGYSRMSLDAVAAAAGASKPTLYRRWESKADVATAALRTMQIAEPAVDTGSCKGDLVAALENFSRSLLRPNGMALIGTVLAEEAHTPELLRLFRERLVAPRRGMLREILERGRRGGELRRRVNIEAVVNLLIGAIYARYLVSSQIPAGFVREVVDTVWSGIGRA